MLRGALFKKNLEAVRKWPKNETSTVEVNKFSDWTPAELEKIRGFKIPENRRRNLVVAEDAIDGDDADDEDEEDEEDDEEDDVVEAKSKLGGRKTVGAKKPPPPKSVDWVAEGILPGIKDQA